MSFTELEGDLLAPPLTGSIEVYIPTNQTLRADGRGIMGAGLAKAAKERWDGYLVGGEGLEQRLGAMIREGARYFGWVQVAPRVKSKKGSFWAYDVIGVWALHTKDHWRSKSDLDLIEKELRRAVSCSCAFRQKHARKARRVFPRLGCGRGGLHWEREVKPLMAQVFDEACQECQVFYVIHPAKGTIKS